MSEKYVLTALFKTDGDFAFEQCEELGIEHSGQKYSVMRQFDNCYDCIDFIAEMFRCSYGRVAGDLLRMVSSIVSQLDNGISDFAHAYMTGNYEGSFMLVQHLVFQDEEAV